VSLGKRKENDYCVLYLYAYVRGERIVKRIDRLVHVSSTVSVCIQFDNTGMSIDTGVGTLDLDYFVCYKFSRKINPCKLSYLLYPYFETDAPENKVIPFAPTIWDVRVNGKMINCKFNK